MSYKQRSVLSIFMALTLFVCAVLECVILHPKKASEQQTETIAESVSEEDVLSESEERPEIPRNFYRPSSRLKEIAVNEPDYEPGPTVLNSAFFYPDDADTQDAINSYGGLLFTRLNSMNAEYYAAFYDLSDKTPLSMAKSMGHSSERVRGKYNPDVSAQSKDDPTTWTLGSFKNINIAYYNGDGRRVAANYSVNNIMAMASVYAYYHDMYDYDAMNEYSYALFDNAFKASVSLGNVYYCSGCKNMTVEEEAEEANRIEKEYAAYIIVEEESDIDGVSESGTAETEETGSAQYGFEQPVYTSETVSNTGGYIVVTDDVESTETPAETNAPETTEAPQTEAETAAADESDVFVSQQGYIMDFSDAEEGMQSGAGIGKASHPYHGSFMVSAAAPIARFFADETSSETAAAEDYSLGGGYIYSDYDTYEQSVQEAQQYQDNNTAETSAAPDISDVSETAAVSETSAPARRMLTEPDAGEDDHYCPGHIDLNVSITIRGLDDKKGLFAVDPIGNAEENFNDRWQGWTEEHIAEVKELAAQDWFELYGLSISSIRLLNPLSDEEVEYYVSRLPEDISDLRRSIIDYALRSVGNIPYYYGGKPTGPDYDINRFGTLTGSDYRGRILRGLDCSGWVNWVYWSVTGEPLKGEATGSLIGCGKKIRRSELQPGDIIVRTGDDAHAVMFLCWGSDGKVVVIHENGTMGNVSVNELVCSWPYYRCLIEE